ncbi:protein kinase protein [Trichomonas vaginalis G3]|uniref:protein kinase protein n=1 Tax=Trichomonas vaginalis (strain ATCC PRA-98 / G3) TaxID=412133 RepID=UPI0021E60031|nr:protein kinase protein [Trichomonas vaginalis G3]KAI5515054.1 protein kinase protein [Trichomonas vaginalis G3]
MRSDLFSNLSGELQTYVIDPSNYDLIEQIGIGGFSEVWLAEDKRTGDKVAYKKIRTDISQSALQTYVREITTMAKAEHPFFLKLIGFSVTSPLVIITEYIANCSLFRFRRNETRRQKLTPTVRTNIALCLAYGMKYLHSLGIIHRDLKSMNILLDDNLLPKLCDFGVARFLSSDEPMTRSAGTPNWMAPELHNDADYGPEVDVYSYGMILYELLTDEIPWKNLDPISVLRKVGVEKQRPRLPQRTDPFLKNLIESCWAEDPKDRPQFKEIYDLFKTGKVTFPGTNFPDVQTVLDKIKEYEQNGKWLSINVRHTIRSTPASPSGSLSKFNLDSRQSPRPARSSRSGSLILSRGTINRSQPFFGTRRESWDKSKQDSILEKAYGKKFIDLEAINDPHSPSFRSELIKASVKLPKIQSRLFMSIIKNYLKDPSNIALVSQVLKALQKIIQRKCHRDSFLKAKLHEMLPLSPGSLLDLSLDIFNVLFSQSAIKFSDWFKNDMITIINERPMRAVVLLSYYAKSFESLPNSWPLLDLLIKKAQIFLTNSCETELISTLFYLNWNFDEYKEARLKQSLKIFLAALESDDINTICLAYNALSHFYASKLVKIDYGLIVEHLDNETTAPHALGYLIRVNDIPALPELINSLLHLATEYHEANLCLVKIAALSEGANYLVRKNNWMVQELPTLDDTLRLFLAVITHEECRHPISHTQNAIILLTKIAKYEEFLPYSAIIIRKIEPDKKALLDMRESDLIKIFIQTALKNNSDEKLENLVLHAIYSLSETGFAPEYIDYCDRLKHDIVSKGRNMLSAMAVVADLARYSTCAEKFMELKLNTLFKQLMTNQDYKEYAEEFFENFDRHK